MGTHEDANRCEHRGVVEEPPSVDWSRVEESEEGEGVGRFRALVVPEVGEQNLDPLSKLDEDDEKEGERQQLQDKADNDDPFGDGLQKGLLDDAHVAAAALDEERDNVGPDKDGRDLSGVEDKAPSGDFVPKEHGDATEKDVACKFHWCRSHRRSNVSGLGSSVKNKIEKEMVRLKTDGEESARTKQNAELHENVRANLVVRMSGDPNCKQRSAVRPKALDMGDQTGGEGVETH
jgi:hypothetical protein